MNRTFVMAFVVLFVISAGVVSADTGPMFDFSGQLYGSGASVASCSGFTIYTNSNITITGIEKASLSTATRAFVYVGNVSSGTGTCTGSQYNGTFSGSTATLSKNVTITAGSLFTVVVDNAGASYTVRFDTSPLTPLTGNSSVLIWRNGVDNAGLFDHFSRNVRGVYFTGNVTNASGSATAEPSWVSPTPADTATNNTQVTLNASSASPGVRYFIWFDTNANPTTLVVNNATTGNYSTSVPSTTTTYYYKAQAWNATSEYSVNTSVRSWTYDAVSPGITLNPSNEFNEQNYSRRDPFDALLHLNITFTDDHDLFGMSVNVTRGGVVYFNVSNESLNGLSYTYNNTVNESSWPVGRYNVSIFVSDSHTAKAISAYQVSSKKSSITFKPGNDNNIKIESRELSTITTTKSIDRYSFRVVFDDASTRARSFDVKTDKCPLTYKPASGYKAHFVSSCGVGGNWIDFEGASGTPSVSRIDDFHYVVSFDSLESDITFHSIGGLNILSVNYTFYKGDYAFVNPSPVSMGEGGLFFLNATTESGISNISAVLNYNGTAHVPDTINTTELFNFSKTVNSPMNEVNLTYNWTVTVTQGDGNVTTFAVTAVQVVTNWSIVSCGTPLFVNWTQYDEDNPATKLTGTFAVEVEYWIGNRSNARFYNASYPSAQSWGLCFSPSPNNFTANIYAQNTVPESFTHRFYVQNVTYSNVTTFYNIYNANDTNDALYSDMKITTRYVASYGYFNNVFAQLQRRYVGEGVWRTVQYDKSGDFGLLFFDVREQSFDYRLRYYDENNSLLLETDSLKFVCTSTICELTQLLNPDSASSPNPDVTSQASFNNVSSILTVVWDSGTATESTVDITVTKRNYGGLVTVCSTTQTGVGGVFACNASGYTGELFVSVDVNDVQNSGEYVTIGRVSLGSFMSTASQVLVTFLLMVAIMAFGLFSPIALVITTIIALVVVFFMGTLTAITATFIVIAAVIGFVIAIKVKQ